MSYKIIILPTADKDIRALKNKEPQAFKKVAKLIAELQEHPETGTGHPKPLGENRTGQWSRRITQKHRLIYQINEAEVIVAVISAYGHYNDK
ncbi:MAG: Txe/YoeB family addiction module toxin [Prevotellaceae bacterium]|jgi:toxin YoeB|nr:Txe/YoeB family addiction module toxin [Prevotellaceae bacterium]